MKIKYNFEKGKLHDICGNPEYETEEFEYEVTEEDLKDAIEEIIDGDFDDIRDFIEEFDLWDRLKKTYNYEIKEYFEEEALEEYNEKMEEN